MKNILILVALLGFVACSSANKDESKEMVAQAETTANETSDEAKAAYDKAQQEAEEAAQKAAAEAQTTTDSADSEFTGNFGPYEGTEKSKTTCTSGEDVRTVAVLDGSNGGCGVVYNKNGEDRTIAVANYDMSFCPGVQEKVKGNLEAAGFTCQ